MRDRTPLLHHRRALVAGLLITACFPKPGDPGLETASTGAPEPGASASSTGASAGTTTAPTDPTTGAGSSSSGPGDSSSGSSDGEGGSSFIPTPPDLGGDASCHQSGVFADCGDQKCTIDGGFTDTHCVPIVDRPKQRGEPCTAFQNALDGADDCAEGLFCWDLDAGGHGVCRQLCMPGDVGADPVPCVADGEICATHPCQECFVSWCTASCDPLVQDCPAGEMCTFGTGSGWQFLCVTVNTPGGYGAPCQWHGECDIGLTCIGEGPGEGSFFAPGCADDPASSCCLPFCDLTAPDCPDADAGVVCTSAGNESQPNAGVCGILP